MHKVHMHAGAINKLLYVFGSVQGNSSWSILSYMHTHTTGLQNVLIIHTKQLRVGSSILKVFKQCILISTVQLSRMTNLRAQIQSSDYQLPLILTALLYVDLIGHDGGVLFALRRQ